MVDIVTTTYLAAPAGEAANYIQRFTFPQSGEVKGCIVAAVPSSTLDSTQTAGSGFCFGFSDGTDEYAFGGSLELNNEASYSRFVNDRVMTGLDFTDNAVVNLEASVDSLGLISGTNDGYVDLDWITPPSDGDERIIAVTVFAGSGVSCKALDVETSGTVGADVAVAFGFKPTMGVLLTNNNSAMQGVGVLPSSSASATIQDWNQCIGWWGSNNDTLPDQHCVSWVHNDGTVEVACQAEANAGRYIATSGTSSVYEGAGVQVRDLTSTGLDLRLLSGAGGFESERNVALFGVEFENSSVNLEARDTPTETGSQSWSQSSRSQFVLSQQTRCAALGSAETDFDGGPVGLSFVDRNTQLSYSWGFRDNIQTSNVFCRVSNNKFSVLPLHDGTLGSGHFDVGFDGFGGHSTFNTNVTFNNTNSTARKWLTLTIEHDEPAQFSPGVATASAVGLAPNLGGSSLELFNLGSAETLLQGVTANGGTLSLDSDEELGTIDCSAATTDAAYWYDKIKLDRTKAWAIQLTARLELDGGNSHPDLFAVVNRSNAPNAAGSVNTYAAEKRIQCGLVNDGSAAARAGYFPAGGDLVVPDYGDGRFWNGSTEAWGATSTAEDFASIRDGATEDFYTWTIFNDPVKDRFCILLQNSADATNLTDDRQGEIAKQTDWVDWGDFSVDVDDLWVVIGDRYINSGNSKYSIDKYERDVGGNTAQRAMVNCKDDLADNYDIREAIGADKIWILAERDSLSITDSETYGSGGIRKRSWIVDDDGIEYLFYEAFEIGGAFGPRGSGGTGETRIKVKTSVDGGATWGSPTTLIAPSDVGAGYQVVTGIQIFKWNDHPTQSERCMLFLTAEVSVSTKSEHRMFVFTAQNLSDTTWTKKSGSGTDGAIFEGTATDTDYDHSGGGDPVVSRVGSTWHMIRSSLHSPASPSGSNPIQGWQFSHATSTDTGTPINWTVGSSPPHVSSNADGIRTASAVDGTEVTIGSGVHDRRQVVLFRRDNSDQDDWGMYRVRKKLSDGVELLQEVVGMSPLTGDSSIAVIGTGSNTPHSSRVLPDGTIEVIGTAFQPFIRGDANGDGSPEGLGNCEFTARWTSTDYENWSIDYEHSPVLIVTDKVSRNAENFSVRQTTVGVPTEIAVTGIPTVSNSRSTVSVGGLGLVPITQFNLTDTAGWKIPGYRYIVTEIQQDNFGWTVDLEIDAPISTGLSHISSSGTRDVVGTLSLTPETPPISITSTLVVGSAGSAVSLSGVALVVDLAVGQLPLNLMFGRSTVGSEFTLELEGDLNGRVLNSGSCVVANLDLTPNCGKIEDVCQPLCKLDIWNAALARLGLPTQSDETASNKYLDRLRLSWTRVRKEMLREGFFNGSTDRRALVKIKDGAQHRSDAANAFELPPCFIKAISANGKRLDQEGSDVIKIATSYERDRRVIYSDESKIELSYIMDISDVNDLDPSAQTALINMLALDIAPAFKDAEEVRELQSWYESHILEARATDTQENTPEEFEDYTDALWWNT